MRLSYYRFPEGTPEDILLNHGCAVVLHDGREIYPDSIPDDKRYLVAKVDTLVGPASITRIKELMKQYGGGGFTMHFDRDGGLFETTDIKLKGNNSKFKYNHHL